MTWAYRTGSFVATSSGSFPRTLILGAAASVGDRIVVVVVGGNAASGGFTVSDNLNAGSYTQDATATSGSSRGSLFSKVVTVAGTPTITATAPSGTGGMCAVAYSGLDTGTGTDGTAAAVTTTTTPSSGATAATHAANELVVGAYADIGWALTISAGAGFTQRGKHDADGASYQGMLEDKDSGASGSTQTTTASTSAGGNPACFMLCAVYPLAITAVQYPITRAVTQAQVVALSRQVCVPRTYGQLEAFTYGQLEAFTYGQLELTCGGASTTTVIVSTTQSQSLTLQRTLIPRPVVVPRTVSTTQGQSVSLSRFVGTTHPVTVGAAQGQSVSLTRVMVPPAPAVLPPAVRRISVSASWTGGSTGIFSNILSARASFGFDKRVSEASIVTPLKPTVTYDDIVTLTMGVVGSNVITRFVGIVRDFRYTDHPRGVETVCRGLLTRAVEYENWEDPQLWGGLFIQDLLGTATGTAADIVKAVLTRANVPYTAANIGGSATLYGDNDEAFLWHNGNSDNPVIDLQEAGETALGYIERYDSIDCDYSAVTGSGGRYRTFETLGGTVYRYLVGGRPRDTQQFTFTGGVDILDGQFERSISDTRNYFVVTGYDPGDSTGPESYALQESNTFQPVTSKHTYRFSSPMIERSNEADAGTGMSCERLANVLSLEFNREIVSGWITTHRDDSLGIAQTHLVQGAAGGLPGRLGVAEKLWVQSLDISVDDQGFTQRISYLGGGTPDDDLPVPP